MKDRERDSHLWKARHTLWKAMTMSWGNVKRVPGFTLENCMLVSRCLPGSHQCLLFRSLILTFLVGRGSPNFIPGLTCGSTTLWLSCDQRVFGDSWETPLGDTGVWPPVSRFPLLSASKNLEVALDLTDAGHMLWSDTLDVPGQIVHSTLSYEREAEERRERDSRCFSTPCWP